jgi:hypothetical protein
MLFRQFHCPVCKTLLETRPETIGEVLYWAGLGVFAFIGLITALRWCCT